MQIFLTKIEEITLFMIIHKISLKNNSIFLENITEKRLKNCLKNLI